MSARQPDHHADADDEFGAYLVSAKAQPTFRAAHEDARDLQRLVDELVAMRRLRGLTQTAVAARMGVRQPTVSEFEKETSDPKLSTLQRYARAVECRVRLFVTASNECDWVRSANQYQHNPNASAPPVVRATRHTSEPLAEWPRVVSSQ